ncbi:hypothetical protein DV737_g741, partial [Chaetothyriales sp. CBS 132003]
MDSMRSLNTSLPAAYSSRPAPREQLLQAFKTAALSVTNLYKSAAADQQSSRDAGYQDALDDLLRMMDSENLGVQDGEGWRIRQWVTERYDHSANTASSDIDDSRTAATDPGRDDAFTAGSSAVDGDDMQVNDDPSKPLEEADASSPSPVLPPPIQVQLINRSNRSTLRSSSQRHGRTSTRTPASAAGTKRKLHQVPDFFDIPNFNFRDDADNGNSGKRGRMV